MQYLTAPRIEDIVKLGQDADKTRNCSDIAIFTYFIRQSVTILLATVLPAKSGVALLLYSKLYFASESRVLIRDSSAHNRIVRQRERLGKTLLLLQLLQSEKSVGHSGFVFTQTRDTTRNISQDESTNNTHRRIIKKSPNPLPS